MKSFSWHNSKSYTYKEMTEYIQIAHDSKSVLWYNKQKLYCMFWRCPCLAALQWVLHARTGGHPHPRLPVQLRRHSSGHALTAVARDLHLSCGVPLQGLAVCPQGLLSSRGELSGIGYENGYNCWASIKGSHDWALWHSASTTGVMCCCSWHCNLTIESGTFLKVCSFVPQLTVWERCGQKWRRTFKCDLNPVIWPLCLTEKDPEKRNNHGMLLCLPTYRRLSFVGADCK